ncbi:MAG: acetate kinase [Alphaproteobacteria bacterium]|nr:acetate kinase [Alphaproteobacteria bacterium]
MKKVLVLNSGSSSLKYQLFDVNGDDYKVLAKGLSERIGIDGSKIKIKYASGNKREVETALPSHEEALREVFKLLQDGAIADLGEITVVGHRVVHGGEIFKHSALIDDKALQDIADLSALAPLHNPAAVIGIKAVRSILPNVPQVAVFDTAFHQTMPREAYLYGLPWEQYEKHHIRRYGAHGTSHRYIAQEMEKILGKGKKLVVCHLGNGASLSAINDGVCIDTSMGFTPLSGIVMGSRCGDVDAYVPLHLMKTQGLSVDEVNNLLNKQSGMLGLTGYPDMREVESDYLAGKPQSVMAMEVYVYNVVRYIGSYMAAMQGLDAIAFTAGIGENSPILRQLVMEKLAFLGIKVNHEANEVHGKFAEVSTEGSKVRCFVVPTDEEVMIARDSLALL